MITAMSINKAEFFSSIIGGKIALHGSQRVKIEDSGSKFILQDGE